MWHKNLFKNLIQLVLKYVTFLQKYEAAQLFSTLIILNKNYWAADQHIRMISEGSYDNEDWSNDAENSALITEINYILKYIQRNFNLY